MATLKASQLLFRAATLILTKINTIWFLIIWVVCKSIFNSKDSIN